jgi:hypothetical protein
MSRAYSTNGKKNANRLKPEGKIPPGRPRHKN